MPPAPPLGRPRGRQPDARGDLQIGEAGGDGGGGGVEFDDRAQHAGIGIGGGAGIGERLAQHFGANAPEAAVEGAGQGGGGEGDGLAGGEQVHLVFIDLDFGDHLVEPAEAHEALRGGAFAGAGIEGEHGAGHGGADDGLVEISEGAVTVGGGGLGIAAGEDHIGLLVEAGRGVAGEVGAGADHLLHRLLIGEAALIGHLLGGGTAADEGGGALHVAAQDGQGGFGAGEAAARFLECGGDGDAGLLQRRHAGGVGGFGRGEGGAQCGFAVHAGQHGGGGHGFALLHRQGGDAGIAGAEGGGDDEDAAARQQLAQRHHLAVDGAGDDGAGGHALCIGHRPRFRAHKAPGRSAGPEGQGQHQQPCPKARRAAWPGGGGMGHGQRQGGIGLAGRRGPFWHRGYSAPARRRAWLLMDPGAKGSPVNGHSPAWGYRKESKLQLLPRQETAGGVLAGMVVGGACHSVWNWGRMAPCPPSSPASRPCCSIQAASSPPGTP